MGDIRSGGRPRELAVTAASQAERVLPRALPGRPLPPRPAQDAPRAAARKPRPDPGPLRIAFALTGMATASALATALLGPPAGIDAGAGNPGVGEAPAATETPAASVQHVTRIVQLAPGQTVPPQAVVKQQPAPKPRVNVVVTKQSGK